MTQAEDGDGRNIDARHPRIANEPSADLPPSELPEEGGKEADRRRYRIIRTLAREHEVTIDGLVKDRNFGRAFSHTSRTTLEEDFRQIEKMLGKGATVIRENATLRTSKVAGSAFAKLGYRSVRQEPRGTDADEADIDDKRRIGEYIVTNLLRKDRDEVIYLSTGTTVYQVALALVQCAATDTPSVSVMLTDNLPIAELLCQWAHLNHSLSHMAFHILGGKADFKRGDIVQETDLSQLDPWILSAAVISATGMNPETGQIYSFRQPGMKERVLRDMKMAQVIVPVVPRKFGITGGRLIYDPEKKGEKEQVGRVYHVVTTSLEKEKKDALKKHNYKVHTVDDAKQT
ncbi:MAG: hypothetical protein JSU63_00550 [Phycisphaerales bacterium]|nr:MAG: hypothetical protein JSU63_00550 [Phycisphaerales bacterium]